MATAELSLSGSDIAEFCIFCYIASGQDEEADVVKKNEELVCFKDINPAAPHHYLVVPTQHINSCFSLHREHINLVKRMVKMGKAVLHDQGVADMSDIRMGFHQPPYISVNHLHLHVLAPASQISKYIEHKFIPDSFWFVTEKSLLRQLNKNELKRKDLTQKGIKDDALVCFPDTKPGATHHYLVVPRMHINNYKALQKDHVPLGILCVLPMPC